VTTRSPKRAGTLAPGRRPHWTPFAVSRRAVNLLSAPVALRGSARHQTGILNARAVAARLREKQVAALKDVAGRGVRLTQLERAGLAGGAGLVCGGASNSWT